MNKTVRRILLIILIGIFCFSTGKVVYNKLQDAREQKASQELAAMVHEIEAEDEAEDEGVIDHGLPTHYAPSGRLKQYDKLYEQNNDLAGWIRIPDSAIDYPVMYTPYNIEKYLRKNFSQNYALSGEPFFGEGWDPEGNFGIIYGHHMEDGTKCADWMFYADEEYKNSHPIVYFDTLTERRQYEVVAAFYTKIPYVSDTTTFRYFQYTGLPDEETFNYYVSQCKKASQYDTGVEPVWGDRLLVLSTCSFHVKNGRFVILLRQITENDQ